MLAQSIAGQEEEEADQYFHHLANDSFHTPPHSPELPVASIAPVPVSPPVPDSASHWCIYELIESARPLPQAIHECVDAALPLAR